MTTYRLRNPFLDGIHDKVRERSIEKKVLLCALGLKLDGTKKIPSFRLVDREDEAFWSVFLVELKPPGLKGNNLKMIIHSNSHRFYN